MSRPGELSSQRGLAETDSMTCVGFLLLPLLLLPQVSSTEPVKVFRDKDSPIGMGDCFGADYFVAYRSAPGGLQLIANFSENSTAVTPPADLRGRMLLQQRADLLGLFIHNLTNLDSRIYVSECWKDGELITNVSEQVLVCQQEAALVQPVVNEEGRTTLQCNISMINAAGISLHWYWETFPTYAPTLFLDSGVSLEPLAEEFQGVLEVKENATTLLLDPSFLRNNPKFYCVVFRDRDCLRFQYFDHDDVTQSWSLFLSPGDNAVLHCPVYGSQQKWETPLGDISIDSTGSSDLYLSPEESNFSLIIPHVTEQHRGKYLCLSSLLQIEYSLFYCPSKKSHTKIADLGGKISLECKHGEVQSPRIQWERQVLPGYYEPIWEMENGLVPLPEDLKGRVNVVGAGDVLVIADLTANDSRAYRCEVLTEAQYEDTSEEYDDYEYSDEEVMCLFKGEFTVAVSVQNSKAGEGGHTNVPAYMVGVIVAGLVVAAAVLIIKRKQFSTKPKESSACYTKCSSDA